MSVRDVVRGLVDAERRFARERMRVKALQAWGERMWSDGHRHFRRASGEAMCECGFTYSDHPTIAPTWCPTLVAACDGSLVKL